MMQTIFADFVDALVARCGLDWSDAVWLKCTEVSR